MVFSLIDLNTDLVSAFGDRQAFIIRWMAAVSLKNAVDRFWRRNYTEEERGRLTEEQNAIKESLLSGVLLKELDPKIRMPVAVTISKIARLVRMFFYPQFLFPLTVNEPSEFSLSWVFFYGRPVERKNKF